MTKQTIYVCNQCGKKDTIFPIREVQMVIPSFISPSLDFCSKGCFFKYFKDKLSDADFKKEKIDCNKQCEDCRDVYTCPESSK